MYPDIPVTLEAEPEKVQIVKDLDKFAEALAQYEIGFKHRWKNWLIKTVAPGEQNIINEKTGSSIEVLSTILMGKDKVKKTLKQIHRLQPKNMQDYFDKLDKEREAGIPPHNPGAEEIIIKYRIIPFPDRDPQGLLFDTREEAENWLRLADVDLPIKEVEGVYKPGVQKVGMLTTKATRVFTPIEKGSSSNPGIPPHAAVVTGEEAEKIATKILEHDGVPYPEPHITGYFPEGNKWTAFDNRAGEMFMEEFWYEKYAKRYAEDLEAEPSELRELDELQKKSEIAKEWEELTSTKMKGVKERDVAELLRVLDYQRSLDKDQGKITWKYNRFGHVEVWKGPEMIGESDLYIQIDYDVGHFFYLIGLSSDPEQIGAPEDIGIDDFDTAEDPGYFTNHDLPECESCG